MPSKSLKIANEKGLHARASAKFVETTERFDARVLVARDGLEVTGDSIMGLLMLAAAKGSTIDVTATGPDGEAALDALTELVDELFGEGK